MGHQRAAMELLVQLYTPDTATDSVTSRMLLSWYTRYDVFVSLMGGIETALPAEWFSALLNYGREQLALEPDSITWKADESSSRLRLISRKISVLFAKAAKGDLTDESFAQEHGRLGKELEEWKATLDPALTDETMLVRDFTYGRPLKEDDIVNPFEPGVLYQLPLFMTTISTCSWHSIVIMHALGRKPQGEEAARLSVHAYAICRIFETIEHWPFTPPGTLIAIHASLAIAALFLPRDDRHHMWMRRKFASLETSG
jgi:hypothetical protein